jgi:hypothetical protein
MRGKRDGAVMPDGTPIRLAPGSHSSPREGVCVVELASVIGEEEFSDRPRCVCPVIGAFLRGWNDRAPHAERQRLGPYAARIVGSRGSPRVARERRDICLEWAGAAGADLGHGVVRRLWSRVGMRLRIAVFCGLGAIVHPNEGAGDYAARIAAARGDAERAFELLDTLLATGKEQRPDQSAATINGNGHARVKGNGRPAIAPHGPPEVNGNGSTANGGRTRVEGLEEVSSNGGKQRARSSA